MILEHFDEIAASFRRGVYKVLSCSSRSGAVYTVQPGPGAFLLLPERPRRRVQACPGRPGGPEEDRAVGLLVGLVPRVGALRPVSAACVNRQRHCRANLALKESATEE